MSTPYLIRFWRDGELAYVAVVEVGDLREAEGMARAMNDRVGAEWWVVGEMWPMVEYLAKRWQVA
jgi:hypothetical protein